MQRVQLIFGRRAFVFAEKTPGIMQYTEKILCRVRIGYSMEAFLMVKAEKSVHQNEGRFTGIYTTTVAINMIGDTFAPMSTTGPSAGVPAGNHDGHASKNNMSHLMGSKSRYRCYSSKLKGFSHLYRKRCHQAGVVHRGNRDIRLPDSERRRATYLHKMMRIKHQNRNRQAQDE